MRERLTLALALGPALIVIVGLFFGGLAAGALMSLNYFPLIGLTDPDFGAYRAVLGDPDIGRSFLLSLHIAFTSTVISAVLAVFAALLLRRTFWGRSFAAFLFQLNLTVPHLVGAIGVLYLFSQSGLIARMAASLGMIGAPAEFPALVYDPYAAGIILLYVWKEVPFIAVVVLANMQAVGKDHEAAARTLGAGRWAAFRHAMLPQIAPGLLSASVLVFAFAFGSYEIPALLGASWPEALPVLAWRL
ncbi:MAG: ABC transporter permease subunit, partial [Pseudomonadota bacterium]